MYLRRGQERDGTSLVTQERECMRYAQAKGWAVVECIKDTASSSNLDRPSIDATVEARVELAKAS